MWHHLFGQGIVSTVDNFGVAGAKPSHPELPDHLAQRFRNDGWSLKRLIRSVVLSHAYLRRHHAGAPANLAQLGFGMPPPHRHLSQTHTPAKTHAIGTPHTGPVRAKVELSKRHKTEGTIDIGNLQSTDRAHSQLRLRIRDTTRKNSARYALVEC